MKLVLSCLILVLLNFQSFGQGAPTGLFDNASDIGKPKKPGSSRYDDGSQAYYLKGSGYNIWFNRDEFQYLYKKINGDFILTADFKFIGEKGNAHRKIGWMIRESLDEGAASYNAVSHGDGLTVLQWRMLKGAFMRDPEDEIFFPKKALFQTIQLERTGTTISMRVANPGEPLQEVGATRMFSMKDSVFVGLYICSHDSDRIEEAKIWNVRIDQPIINKYSPNPQVKSQPVQGTMGCRLETMNIVDGVRKIIYQSEGRFDSPSWTDDGKKILFNEKGSISTIPAQGGNVEQLNTSLATPPSRKVDGREYSPDGKFIYYSANPAGTMQIWRMRADSSAKEQLSFDDHHNWFPHISPDGKWLVYLSYPNDIDPNDHPSYQRVTLNLMPASGGAARVIAYLYGGEGTLNANPWSPDSRQIAFVSNSAMTGK